MKESLLKHHLIDHLDKKGYKYLTEVPFLERRIDVVGNKEEKTYSFELKVANWKRVFQQALSNLLCVDYSNIAMFKNKVHLLNLEMCKELGIGVLSIDETGKVENILDSQQSRLINPSLYNKISKQIEGYNDLQTILSFQSSK